MLVHSLISDLGTASPVQPVQLLLEDGEVVQLGAVLIDKKTGEVFLAAAGVKELRGS